jgi:hypothetical protein
MRMSDFIEIYPETLSTTFCQQFIELFEQSPHKVSGRTGGGVDENKKLSQDIYLNEHAEFHASLQTISQAFTQNIQAYINKYFFSLISGLSLTINHPQSGQPLLLTEENYKEFGEPLSLQLMQNVFRVAPVNAQKYPQGKGNYQYWHSEIFPAPAPNNALHRVLLFLIYLNDVEEGGETDFYYQKRSVRPKAGDMVVAPCGFTHTHRGNIPISADKYVLTSWVMYQPAEKLYASQ